MQTGNNSKKAISQSALVKSLLKHDYNRKCADCQCTSVTWAVLNLGALVCADCASIHRSFGTHISIVKSLSLDNWKPEYLEYMSKHASNAAHNSKYESTITNFSKPKPDSSRQAKERFLKDKYINKLWFKESGSVNEKQGVSEVVKETKPVIIVQANPVNIVGRREIKRKYPVGHPSKGINVGAQQPIAAKTEESLLILDNDITQQVPEKPKIIPVSTSELDEFLLPIANETPQPCISAFIVTAKLFDMNDLQQDKANEQEVAKKKIMSLFESPVVPKIVKPHFAPIPIFSHQ